MLTVGRIIKKEREMNRITQEELSDGLCTPSYLSRLENGQVNPSPEIIKAILERLGKDYNKYITYKSEYEYGLEQLKYDIRRFEAINAFDKHEINLNELEMRITVEDKITIQFVQLHKVFISERNGLEPELLLESLKQALNLTKSKIDLMKLSKEFLTQVEVVIINNIAIQLKAKGDIQHAIDILLELKRYLDQPHMDHDQVTRTYPLVICNLCKWLSSVERYYECLAMCDHGIAYCLKHGCLDIFPDVNFYKGFALEKIGQSETARTFVIQSYYIARSMNSELYCELIREYYNEYYKDYYPDFKLL